VVRGGAFRLEPSTAAKYRSVIDNQLLPQWRVRPMMGSSTVRWRLKSWVSELHEEYADSKVSTVFATFFTVMNAGCGCG
jgi:hypothetical protein